MYENADDDTDSLARDIAAFLSGTTTATWAAAIQNTLEMESRITEYFQVVDRSQQMLSNMSLDGSDGTETYKRYTLALP